MFNPIQIKHEYSGIEDINQPGTPNNSKCSNFVMQDAEPKYRQPSQFWEHAQMSTDVALKNEIHLHSDMFHVEESGTFSCMKDYLQNGVFFQINQHAAEMQNIGHPPGNDGCQPVLTQENQQVHLVQNVQHPRTFNQGLAVVQSVVPMKQNRPGRPPKDTSEPSAGKKFKCQCEICFKEFGHKSNLFIHMRTHNGERPYKCTQCEKCFTHSGNLAIHMRTHSGERPYGCQICGKMFSHSGNLSTHLRTHSGVKPYKCSICAKEFRHSGNLSIHERIHSGIKPFQCKVCGKDFYHSGNLTTHMKKHSISVNSNVNQCMKNKRQVLGGADEVNDSTSTNVINKATMISPVESMHNANNIVPVKNECGVVSASTSMQVLDS